MFRFYFLIAVFMVSFTTGVFSQKVRTGFITARYTKYPLFALPPDMRTIQINVIKKNRNQNLTSDIIETLKKKCFSFDSLTIAPIGTVIVDLIINDELPFVNPNAPVGEQAIYYNYKNQFIVKDYQGRVMQKGEVFDYNSSNTYKVTTAPKYDIGTYTKNLEGQFRALNDFLKINYDLVVAEDHLHTVRVKGEGVEMFDSINNYIEIFFKRNKVTPPYTAAKDSLAPAIAYFTNLESTRDKNKKEDLPFIFASGANLSVLYTVIEDYENASKQIDLIKSLDYKDNKSLVFEDEVYQRKKNRDEYEKTKDYKTLYIEGPKYMRCFYIDTLGRRFSSSIENYMTQMKKGEVVFVDKNHPNVVDARAKVTSLKYLYVDGILFKSVPAIKKDNIFSAYPSGSTHDFESAFYVVMYESSVICLMMDLSGGMLMLNNKKLDTWSITSYPKKDEIIIEKLIRKFFNNSLSDCPQLAEMMDGGKLDFKTKKIPEYLKVIEEYEGLCGSGQYNEMIKQNSPEELNKKLEEK